MLYFPTSPK